MRFHRRGGRTPGTLARGSCPAPPHRLRIARHRPGPQRGRRAPGCRRARIGPGPRADLFAGSQRAADFRGDRRRDRPTRPSPRSPNADHHPQRRQDRHHPRSRHGRLGRSTSPSASGAKVRSSPIRTTPASTGTQPAASYAALPVRQGSPSRVGHRTSAMRSLPPRSTPPCHCAMCRRRHRTPTRRPRCATDRARVSFDRLATYIIAAFLAGAARYASTRPFGRRSRAAIVLDAIPTVTSKSALTTSGEEPVLPAPTTVDGSPSRRASPELRPSPKPSRCAPSPREPTTRHLRAPHRAGG